MGGFGPQAPISVRAVRDPPCPLEPPDQEGFLHRLPEAVHGPGREERPPTSGGRQAPVPAEPMLPRPYATAWLRVEVT